MEVSCIINSNIEKPTTFYPIWRRWLYKPSYSFAEYLVKSKQVKHPQRISYLMIITGIMGSTLLLSSDIVIRIDGWVLLILAYFFDMLDGKTSRMLNKPLRQEINYLDNNFHIPVVAYTLFIVSIRVYLNTNNLLFLAVSFFLPWIFIWKGLMQHSFEYHYLALRQPTDVNKYQEEQTREQYHSYMYDTKGIKHYAYVCIRPFLDATDIWFALLPVMIFGLDAYYIVALLILHSSLLFYKFKKHTALLNPEHNIITEQWFREKKKPYDTKVMLDKDKAIRDLRIVSEILDKYDMKCWLYGGTLLGAIRNNDFISGDGDIDLVYCGDANDFYLAENDLLQRGYLLDVYYNHVKILSSNQQSKICISIYQDREKFYAEDVLKINPFGSVLDSIIWMFQYPPEYKYESILTLRQRQIVTKMLRNFPDRYHLFKLIKILYAKFGYITTEFYVPKEYVDPIKKITFRDIDVYCPANEDKIFELFYGTGWRTPTEEYTGRTLRIVSNKEVNIFG